MNFAQFGKAAYAFLVAGLGSLATVMVGDVGFTDIQDGQWLTAVLVALVAAGGVYQIPYVSSKGE
jgi:hypothetical protein